MSPSGNPPASDLAWMRVAVDEVIIEVTARPGTSRRGVIGVTADRLVIGVNSRPEKGKANDELIEYLAKRNARAALGTADSPRRNLAAQNDSNRDPRTRQSRVAAYGKSANQSSDCQRIRGESKAKI